NAQNNRTGISITWNQMTAFIYNQLTIEKFDCAPLNPEFSGRPPIVLPYRFVLKPSDISEVEGLLRINLNDYGIVFKPENTLVYFRSVEGNGTFMPLETEYLALSNELIVNLQSPG